MSDPFYLLDLVALDTTKATFTVAPIGFDERTTLTIPADAWVNLGRPGRVTVAIKP